jgi:stage V sporulation protein G
MQNESSPSLYSSIKITLMNRDSLRAMASCVVGGAIVLTGMRVVEGKNGIFVSMPQRKNADGSYHDVAYPSSREMRDSLQRAILDAFHKEAHNQPSLAAA